jgi:hypothetical protein
MTQTTKHTPGPWQSANTWVQGTREHSLAIVPLIARVNRANDAYEANARLIAAAPELLTTLKQLVQAIALHGDKALNAAGLDSTVRQACDVIAKATGEKP